MNVWTAVEERPLQALACEITVGFSPGGCSSLADAFSSMNDPPVGKGCYSSSAAMPYRVISFTMAQVRQGALGFQRDLSAVLREHAGIKVYSVSPFDLDERRRFKDRFGGDIVYFLNEAAYQECERLGLNLQLLAEISDDELPRRRTLVVGIPERTQERSS